MAMALRGKNRHYRWLEIGGRHFLETARRCGFGQMPAVMDEVIAKTPGVIEQARALVPSPFAAHIAGSILDGVRAQAERLKAELAHS
jgi:serine/threonine-protein kinase HipA